LFRACDGSVMDQKSLVFKFGGFEVAERELTVTRAGQTLALEPKALRVLLYLLHNPGRLVTKEELLSAVWPDVTVGENSLSRAIALLRKVLDDDSRESHMIETVPTAGYRFICPVETIQPDRTDLTAAAISVSRHTRGLASQKTLMFAITACATGAGVIWLWWYLSRPLAPPRIRGYTQITRDGRDKYLAGTDGNRLYFTQMSPRSINQIGVNGGEMAQIPLAIQGDKFALADISPDGSTGLIASYDRNPWSLWVIPMLGGAARHVGDAERGAFSPDGESVIYATLGGEVMVVRRDGTDTRKLANMGPGADHLRWSPDHRVIRFEKDDGLWEMASDGSGLHRLMLDWHERGFRCCGRWSPDGDFYVFLLYTANSPGAQIWALDERHGLFRRPHSLPVQLTSGPVQWRSPAFSVDGKKIFAEGFTPVVSYPGSIPRPGGFNPFWVVSPPNSCPSPPMEG
jgi:DNA-binding winged helix-turn-helix (wHTH) protein